MPSTTAPRVGQPTQPHRPPVGAPAAAPAMAPPPAPATGPALPRTPTNGHARPLPLQRPRAGENGQQAPAPQHAAPPPPAPPQAAPVSPGAVVPEDTGAWALVTASQAGDMSAFSLLFDRYYDVVFRYVLFRMGDRNLAEDITQETFLRALRRISSVNYQGKDIGAWFVTIARNLIFDHVKSSRYRLESTTAEIVELSPSTSGPEQQVLDGATHEELLRCVHKLNPDQQECIQLRFLQGLSVAETAQIMSRNEGAVKALQHRAVRRLAQLLPEGLR
jgi:RNA polymerase sigma-70 factor (ECF subfamily)